MKILVSVLAFTSLSNQAFASEINPRLNTKLFQLALEDRRDILKIKFSAKLTCKPKCSTERRAPNADAIGNCFATDTFDLDLKKDGKFDNLGWRSKAGWDGDQYLSQFFDLTAIEELKNGRTIVKGIQREGFNHGDDYISEYDIICSRKY